MPDIRKSFESLPIDQLICAPIKAVAQGQSELCQVYLEHLFELAFEQENGKSTKKTRVIEFNLNRNIITPDGEVVSQPIKVEAPLLALVPVPAFTMEEATVRFTMEVKEINTDHSKTDTESSLQVGIKKWGFNSNITGKVTTSSEHTRSSDHSAKYDIFARAIQQSPVEGMAKLTQIFASVIEPISVQESSS